MNYEEFTSWKLLKLNYKREYQISQTFCWIASPNKFVPPSLIVENSECQKSSSESYRTQWNLMNDEEFVSF